MASRQRSSGRLRFQNAEGARSDHEDVLGGEGSAENDDEVHDDDDDDDDDEVEAAGEESGEDENVDNNDEDEDENDIESEEESDDGTSRRKSAKWTPVLKAELLDAMIKLTSAKARGAPKSIKSSAWKKIADLFNKKCKKNFDKKQLQSCYSNMKKVFIDIKQIMSYKGFTWDEKHFTLIGNDSAWKRVPPSLSGPYKGYEFPFYSKFDILVGDNVATGSTARDFRARNEARKRSSNIESRNQGGNSGNTSRVTEYAAHESHDRDNIHDSSNHYFNGSNEIYTSRSINTATATAATSTTTTNSNNNNNSSSSRNSSRSHINSSSNNNSYRSNINSSYTNSNNSNNNNVDDDDDDNFNYNDDRSAGRKKRSRNSISSVLQNMSSSLNGLIANPQFPPATKELAIRPILLEVLSKVDFLLLRSGYHILERIKIRKFYCNAPLPELELLLAIKDHRECYYVFDEILNNIAAQPVPNEAHAAPHAAQPVSLSENFSDRVQSHPNQMRENTQNDASLDVNEFEV